MSLLRESNTFCRRLGRDDRGVILALTAVVFLSLFLMASGVMAIGETVRRRIELQNAVDAAAYAAALTQADTISRVAAINKAMAWSWVQSTRLEMDFCFDVFLAYVLQKQRDTVEWAFDKNDDGNTFKGLPFWGVIGLIPSGNAGPRGGTAANHEPEYTGTVVAANPPMPDSVLGDAANSLFAGMAVSEQVFAELKQRALKLEERYYQLRDERDELTPHKADPFNLLSNKIPFPNDTGVACIGSGETATLCDECAAWRSRRNQYLADMRQLETDTNNANKQYLNQMQNSADALAQDVNDMADSLGGMDYLQNRLPWFGHYLNDLRDTLKSFRAQITTFEMLGLGALGIGQDFESGFSELTESLRLYQKLLARPFIPPTIGVNSHWLLSIYASIQRLAFRLENTTLLETVFPSLGIAGQRIRIMRMNQAIDNLLFAPTDGKTALEKRMNNAAGDALRANFQNSYADSMDADGAQLNGYIWANSPAEYFYPYNAASSIHDDDPETRFLAMAGYTDTPRTIFGRGWHTGNNANGWYRRPDNKTIGRFYKQQNRNSPNTARWIFWSSRWLKIDLLLFKIIIPTYIGWGEENGGQKRSGNSWGNNTSSVGGDGYLTGTAALKDYGGIAKWLLSEHPDTWPRPHYLDNSYFNGKGNITVAASRKMTNPFAFISSMGMFKAFAIPNHMWAVSSSMAGYRLPAETWKEENSGGANFAVISEAGYRLSYADEGEIRPGAVDMNKLWNLRVTDWDALLISGRRAAYTGGILGAGMGSGNPGNLYQKAQDTLGVRTPAPGGMSGNPGNPGSQGRFGQIGTSNGAAFKASEVQNVLWH